MSDSENRMSEMMEAAMIGVKIYLDTTRGSQHRAVIEQVKPGEEFVVHCGDGTDYFFEVMEI